MTASVVALSSSPATAGEWGEIWGDILWGSGGPVVPVPSLTSGAILLLAVLLSAAALFSMRTHKKRSILLMTLAVLVPIIGRAAQIAVPNTFSNGTTADANEVNQNFSLLVGESNNQDSRLGALEASPGLDQATADLAYVNVAGDTIFGSLQVNGAITSTTQATFNDLFWANGAAFLSASGGLSAPGGASFANGAASINAGGTASFPDLLVANGAAFVNAGGTASFPDLFWANGAAFLSAAGGLSAPGGASFANGATDLGDDGSASFANGLASINSGGTASFPEVLWANGTSFLAFDGGMQVAGGAAVIASSGSGTFSSVTITGGADIAEPFEIGGEVAAAPGMLVAIDPASPGQLRIADHPYDRTVAGVVSGAGEVRPGMVLRQEGSAANGDHPVALTGRVYAWVDADANGPVEPGDLLTTSGTAGHAMRVTDHDRARGAVIGKAMTGQDRGQGLVLVLVSLQ